MVSQTASSARDAYNAIATIRVTAIQTGTASAKRAMESGRPGRPALERAFVICRDTQRTGPLPILAYLVEHPEGRFIVDTGASAASSTPGYLPRWNPFFTRNVRIKVAPAEEIGPQLHAMGIHPARDISAVIMTHLHHDHTGGLHHFPHTPIIVGRRGWQAAKSPKGRLMGCLPQRWPIWLQPTLIELSGPPLGPFAASYPITTDGRISLVPTPGHFPDHLSLVVRGDRVTYFLAGDATYNQPNLRAEIVEGVTYDPAASLQTLRTINAFAAQEPTIILPAHDPDGPRRLAAGEIYC